MHPLPFQLHIKVVEADLNIFHFIQKHRYKAQLKNNHNSFSLTS